MDADLRAVVAGLLHLPVEKLDLWVLGFKIRMSGTSFHAEKGKIPIDQLKRMLESFPMGRLTNEFAWQMTDWGKEEGVYSLNHYIDTLEQHMKTPATRRDEWSFSLSMNSSAGDDVYRLHVKVRKNNNCSVSVRVYRCDSQSVRANDALTELVQSQLDFCA